MASPQRSAGFVIYRASPQPPHIPLFLLLDYGRHWDYPKGHVEKGEDDLVAALRELKEETGIADARPIEEFHHEIAYFFRDKKGVLVHKTVIFFLAQTVSTEVILSHEHIAAEFLPYDQAYERLTYANAKKALSLANEFIHSHLMPQQKSTTK